MKRTTKSVFALVIVIAMCFSFCVPTFAAAQGNEPATVGMCPGAGQTHTVANCDSTVVVTVPKTCLINGYELSKCQECGDEFVSKLDLAPGAHNWVPDQTVAPDCITTGSQKYVCANDWCNESYTETLPTTGGHTWGEAVKVGDSCTSEGSYLEHTCTKCGTTEKIPGSEVADALHNWVLTGVEQLPVCITAGWTEFKCADCDITKRVVIKAEYVAHNFPAYTAADVVTQPGCATAGLATVTCTQGCGVTKNVTVPATGNHDFSVVISPKAETCYENGRTAGAKCAECGCDDPNNTSVVIDNYDGHDMSPAVTVDPTCTTKGSITSECQRPNCNYKDETILDEQHSYGDTPNKVEPATCTSYGYNFYGCTVCGNAYYAEKLEKIPHDFTVEVVDQPGNCTTDRIYHMECSVCGEEKAPVTVPAPGHSYVSVVTPATCVAEGFTTYTCSVATCGDSYVADATPINPNYHGIVGNNGAPNVTYPTEPTCTTPGTKYSYCPLCRYSSTETVGALGHNYVEVPGSRVDYTCGTPSTWDEKCSRCDDVIHQTGSDVDAHLDIQVQSHTDATCTEPETTIYKCVACNTLNLSVEYGAPATGHDYQFTETVLPSCANPAAKGGENHTCTRCNDVMFIVDETAVYNPNLPEHHTGDGVYVEEYLPATCNPINGQGYSKYQCEDCNGFYLVASEDDWGDCDYFKGNIIPAVDAKCYADGNTEGYTCTSCGTVYAPETIDKSTVPHHMVTDAAVAPTCTDTGLTEGSHCDNPGCDYKIAQTVVSKLGHNIVNDDRVEPDCENTGLTAGSHCTRCNGATVAQQTIPALGHRPATDAAVAPTCLATGLTEGSHCSVCNKTLVAQNVVDALGHAWALELTVPATCTGRGYDLYACTRCEEKERDVNNTREYIENYTDANGHGDYIEAVRVEAGCYTDGYITYKCEDCGVVDETKTETLGKVGYHYITVAGNKVQLQSGCVANAVSGTCESCGTVVTSEHANLKTATVPATCLEYGYEVEWCDCGYRNVISVTESFGAHTYDDVWFVVTENKVGVNGLEERFCTVCGSEESRQTQIIPAKDGLEFNYTVENVNGGSVIANSNTFNVIISTNAVDIEVFSISLKLKYNTNVITFVGGELLNTKFGSYNITKADRANGEVIILADVVAGNVTDPALRVNTTLDAENEAFAVLTFVVNDVNDSNIDIDVVKDGDQKSSIVDVNNVPVDADFGAGVDHDIVKLGDLAGDDDIAVIDANKIVEIAKNDVSGDDEYVAQADINKDGVVDLKDYTFLRLFLVGNITYDELCAITPETQPTDFN